MLTAELVSLIVLAPVQLSKDRSERNLVAIKWKRLLLPRSLASFPFASPIQSPPYWLWCRIQLIHIHIFPFSIVQLGCGRGNSCAKRSPSSAKTAPSFASIWIVIWRSFFFVFLNGYFDLFAVQNFPRKFSLKHIPVFFSIPVSIAFTFYLKVLLLVFFFLFEKLMTLHWLLPVGVFDCTHPPPTPLAHVWY